jgi:hypothetical protein
MTPRRTEFTAFVLDLLAFIEEKIGEAWRTIPRGSGLRTHCETMRPFVPQRQAATVGGTHREAA